MLNTDHSARCNQCGQVIVPGSRQMRLTFSQRRIYNAVKKRPRTVEQLHDLLYGDDPNGGPGVRIIYVMVNQANKVLKNYGLKLRSIDRNYFIVEIAHASA